MEKKRRIGLGVMGWGSALFMMKTRFASPEAAAIREELMQLVARTSYEASIDLAVEKGMFAYCDPKKHAEAVFVKQLNLSEEYMTKLRTTGIRNASLMSQQPNGNCQTLDTVIQTLEYGDISYEDLIKEQFADIDIKSLVDGQTLQLKTPITVKTFEGNEVVYSIYINGFSDVIVMELSNGEKLKQTKKHKYLVKINNSTAKWVESKDLEVGIYANANNFKDFIIYSRFITTIYNIKANCH